MPAGLSVAAARACPVSILGVDLMMAADAPAPDPALLGILTLLAAERDPKASPPTEVLLARAGLSYSVIAGIVDKTPGAVRKAASRADKPGAKSKR